MHTLPRQFQALVVLVVSATLVGGVAVARTLRWDDWLRLLPVFVMAVVAFSVSIPDPRGGAVTPSTVVSYLAAYVLSPVTALLVIGMGRTLGYVLAKGWIPWRAMFNGALMALSVAAGALVFRSLGGVPGSLDLGTAYAFVAAPIVHHLVNNFFVSYAVSSARRLSFLDTWLTSIRALLLPNLMSVPTAILLGMLYSEVHSFSVLAYLPFLPLQWRALDLYLKRRKLYAQIVDGLVVAMDASLPLGRGHARRVADLAVAIAREMRLRESLVESIEFAALLHDVGLIGKDDILEKPTFSAEHIRELQEHVRVGAEIAGSLARGDIGLLIRSHHEKYDGSGYPDGLAGNRIPLGARIIGLAETVDSMVRGIYPYDAPTSWPEVVKYVVSERGRSFDPQVVEAFEKLVGRAEFVEHYASAS
jgi:HD-GYP domain-containing protein (c-di-GMP phosphodiesterase class II)